MKKFIINKDLAGVPTWEIDGTTFEEKQGRFFFYSEGGKPIFMIQSEMVRTLDIGWPADSE